MKKSGLNGRISVAITSAVFDLFDFLHLLRPIDNNRQSAWGSLNRLSEFTIYNYELGVVFKNSSLSTFNDHSNNNNLEECDQLTAECAPFLNVIKYSANEQPYFYDLPH